MFTLFLMLLSMLFTTVIVAAISIRMTLGTFLRFAVVDLSDAAAAVGTNIFVGLLRRICL
jgi:hypothetical protein